MSKSLERAVDHAIDDFFDALLTIANRNGVNALDVIEIAERRGCGSEGFETWLEDDA